jgi:hypothetical protein
MDRTDRDNDQRGMNIVRQDGSSSKTFCEVETCTLFFWFAYQWTFDMKRQINQ